VKRRGAFPAPALAALVATAALLAGCNLQSAEGKPRSTFFVGVDTSGSFQRSGSYDDALSFLAHYIYGHLNRLGGLEQPREMFVAAIGGSDPDEPQAFRPIHDFAGKDIPAIEKDLRAWFPPNDALTDFNPFFEQVARIVKDRNLVLAPINLMIVTDGVPDFKVPGARAGSQAMYERIDLGPLEYLSRRTTLRLAYVSPKVGERWRDLVPRQRLRLWTVDAEVMHGWRHHLGGSGGPADQARLWEWIQHNVDYRVRSVGA
jgi:hypothetical protein